MKAIILLGAPGAGKGTLAENVRDQAGYVHVSTGDMLRAAIRAGSPTGLEAKSYMESGALVPDEVIMRIVRERLAAGDASAKYMFDGFPRTEVQARMLDETLAAMGARVDQVFLLDVAPEVIVKRLSGRRICRGCGAVYHVVNIPPKVDGVCDACGGELYQRPDDSESTVLNRLDVYNRQTAALISFYEAKGVLVRIDAARSPSEAAAEMLSKLH
ncbi:MAG: adenylate kinase [Kiritimatiellae bacterium]|nr:adenylate kinase [Kiritimatiellia bacterium]